MTDLCSPVVRVHEEFRESTDLTGPVPAITAVHQHWPPLAGHQLHHHVGSPQELGDVGEPVRAAQLFQVSRCREGKGGKK